MNFSSVHHSPERRALSPAIPWLLFFLAGVPYLGSLFIAVVEIGNPPYTGNDWLQKLLLAGWVIFFGAAILTARATRDRPTFFSIATFCVTLSALGLFFVL